MIKRLIFFLFLTYGKMGFANLYLQTEYQEARNPKVVSKHHIFLNKSYTVNYSKKSYVLLLSKINEKEAMIECESFNVDKKGHKEMHGGSVGTYKIGNSFSLSDHDANGRSLFALKIVLEKFVPTVP